MITHENLHANFRQLMLDYFPATGGVNPPDMAIVSWLPFYHDMGLVLGVVAPILGGFRGELTSPVALPATPRPLAAGIGRAIRPGRRHPTSRSNSRRRRQPTTIWSGTTLEM